MKSRQHQNRDYRAKNRAKGIVYRSFLVHTSIVEEVKALIKARHFEMKLKEYLAAKKK